MNFCFWLNLLVYFTSASSVQSNKFTTIERKEYYSGSLLLVEMTTFPKLPIKLTAVSVLQYQENPFSIMKPSIEAQDVGVPKTGLDLHFSPQLMMNPVLFHLLLENYLQCHYILALKIKSELLRSNQNLDMQSQVWKKEKNTKEIHVYFNAKWTAEIKSCVYTINRTLSLFCVK